MKAWNLISYGDFDSGIQLRETTKPVPAPDEILIKCRAASLNPVDFKFAEGQLRMFYRQKLPAGLGFDVSGVITDCGNEVKDLKVGDEVFCCIPTKAPGALQQFLTVKASLARTKPSNLSHAEAASTPLVGLTMLSCMEKLQLKRGNRILIHAGSGGVGSLAIQYAKHVGAEVFTTTGTDNAGWVKKLGADHVIDYKTNDYREVANKLDAVLDTLGGDYTTDAFKLLNPGGTVVSIAGRRLDDETARQYGMNIFLRALMKVLLLPISLRCMKYKAHYHFVLNEPDGARLERLRNLLEAGTLKSVINKVYEFGDAVSAFKMQQSGRSKGKNVIEISH